MKRLAVSRFGFIVAAAIVVALGVGLLAAPQVSAQDPTASVDSVTGVEGEQIAVHLRALDIGSPGLGAWEVGIVYDPSAVSVVSCSAAAGSVCNANFAADQVRITGASASGLEGDTSLAVITFRCDDIGSSTLTNKVLVFADATVGSPQAIGQDVQDGRITCAEASGVGPPPPTGDGDDEPAATDTPVVAGLPDAGTGGSPGGGIPGWLIAVLASAALTTIAGPAALRLRAARA